MCSTGRCPDCMADAAEDLRLEVKRLCSALNTIADLPDEHDRCPAAAAIEAHREAMRLAVELWEDHRVPIAYTRRAEEHQYKQCALIESYRRQLNVKAW